jgi:hypothetical protein
VSWEIERIPVMVPGLLHLRFADGDAIAIYVRQPDELALAMLRATGKHASPRPQDPS